jgi:hypothetical protein
MRSRNDAYRRTVTTVAHAHVTTRNGRWTGAVPASHRLPRPPDELHTGGGSFRRSRDCGCPHWAARPFRLPGRSLPPRRGQAGRARPPGWHHARTERRDTRDALRTRPRARAARARASALERTPRPGSAALRARHGPPRVLLARHTGRRASLRSTPSLRALDADLVDGRGPGMGRGTALTAHRGVAAMAPQPTAPQRPPHAPRARCRHRDRLRRTGPDRAAAPLRYLRARTRLA